MKANLRLWTGIALVVVLAIAATPLTYAADKAAGKAKPAAACPATASGAACCPTKTEDGKYANPVKTTEDGWMLLFDGSALDCWQNARKPDAENKWTIDGDAMTNAPHGNDIATKCDLKDFDLQLEYKTVKGGNSGIYLRGRIEVQVLDSFGKEQVGNGDDGGIYGQFAPKVNASKPAGEWNQLEAHCAGDTVTVKLNGQVVIDNQKISQVTGGALPGGVGDPGPLMLQGDHGKVWYRNIKVKAL